MSTNRDIVSKVRGLLKLTSSDQMVSDRLVLSVVQSVNVKLVTQQLQRRIGTNSPNLFTEIPCIQMKTVPLYSCCDTESDCEIACSVEELPSIVEGYYGTNIQGVYTIDRKVKIKEISSPQRYSNIQKIYPKNKDIYYFILNKRLYITDPNIEVVRLSAFFMDIDDLSKYTDCHTCGDNSSDCPDNPLDNEFKTLPKLEDDICKMAAQEIMSTYKSIQSERTSDDLEGN